ncbi:hypothetical protein ABT294_24840 [Nonomuraea sp. NPDC000554]|uniref:hypothetical protein n=1 Tax=Nonomuraea sp. NPDC000554 TaxID=3154259 RepID=UPI00331F9E15
MGFADVCAAELIKFRTLPSNKITLACAVLAATALAILLGTNVGPDGNIANVGPGAQVIATPMQIIMYSMLILGVLSSTSELRNGTFRVTMSVAPWRNQVLAGKIVTIAVIALAAAVVGLLLTYGGSLITTAGTEFAPLSGGGAGTILPFLGSVPLVAVLGAVVGLLVRSTAAALSIVLVWAFAVESILAAILPDTIFPYLPFMLIGAGVGLVRTGPGPVLGLVIFAVYVAIVAGVTFFVHGRRDIV